MCRACRLGCDSQPVAYRNDLVDMMKGLILFTGCTAGVGRRIARFRVMLAKGVTALLYRLVVASGDRGQRASAWAIADRRQRTSVLSPRWSTKAKPSRTLAAR